MAGKGEDVRTGIEFRVDVAMSSAEACTSGGFERRSRLLVEDVGEELEVLSMLMTCAGRQYQLAEFREIKLLTRFEIVQEVREEEEEEEKEGRCFRVCLIPIAIHLI